MQLLSKHAVNRYLFAEGQYNVIVNVWDRERMWAVVEWRCQSEDEYSGLCARMFSVQLVQG